MKNSTPAEQAKAIATGHALDAEDGGYPPPTRESSKEMVMLAQEVFSCTNNHETAPMPQDEDTIRWLIESARSLAGSVLSQADPED